MYNESCYMLARVLPALDRVTEHEAMAEWLDCGCSCRVAEEDHHAAVNSSSLAVQRDALEVDIPSSKEGKVGWI